MNKKQIFELMKITNQKMYDKFRVRSLKHSKDDILNNKISIKESILNLNALDLVNHLNLEVKEFNDEWTWRYFEKAQNESIDIMNMSFLNYFKLGELIK